MKKLRNMAMPKKALLFLLCALVPLSGMIGLILLAQPTLAADPTPGEQAYYDLKIQEGKERLGWKAVGTPYTEYGGAARTVLAEGPWNLETGVTPWNGGSTAPTASYAGVNAAGTAVTIYRVYTAEQFRYAVTNWWSFELMNDIDLNGQQGKQWANANIAAATAAPIMIGGGHTVYNFYIDSTTTKADYMSLFGSTRNNNFMIRDFTVSHFYMTSPGGSSTISGSFAPVTSRVGGGQFLRVYTRNGFVKGSRSGLFACGGAAGAGNFVARQCGVYDSVIQAPFDNVNACVSGAFQHLNATTSLIENCFSIDTVVVSDGHSGGFFADGYQSSTIRNCFSNNEVYDKRYENAVFIGSMHGSVNVENCFSSGIIEGTVRMGGFIATMQQNNAVVNITNCYSTSAVGLASNAAQIGGFVGSIDTRNAGTNMKMNLKNCYAAGEVGALDTNVAPNRPAHKSGGFIGDRSSNTMTAYTFTNCYYDKQATGMREWEADNAQDGGAGDVAGIKGLLTEDTVKAGAGLMGTTPKTGLTAADGWVLEDGLYPQLAVFANATAVDWGSQEIADMVKAYSLASVSAIKLDNWKTGYDGVTPLGANVYDTVRDITMDFPLSSGAATQWLRVGDGPYSRNGTGNTTEINGVSLPVLRLTPAGNAYGAQYRARELQPGVEWLRVNAKIGTQVGTRALRVVPTSGLAAGPNAALVRGVVDTYNHRDGVRLSYSTGPDMAAIPPMPIKEMVFKSATTDFINIDVPTQLQLEQGLPPIPPGKLHVRVSPLEGYSPNGDPILGTPLALTNTAADPLSKQLNGETPVLLTGRYVVEYFWVMNDGRYMRGQKLMDLSSAVKNARVSEDGGSTWLDWDNGLEDEPVTVRAGDWIEYEIAVDYAGRDLPARVIDERVFGPQTTE